jgi:exodeoxyribonuclease VII small subunit
MAKFEEQLEELERVVEQLERGDLPLEDSVALFERGMLLSTECKTQLATAEGRVQVLMEPGAGGVVRVAEFEVDEDALDEGEDS